jgi:hypothetical protein
MAAQTLQVSFFTVDVIRGTAIADAVLGTVAGAVHGAKAIKIKDNGQTVTYQVIVVHDDGTPINLEYSFITQSYTENTTPDLDNTGLTVAGATQAVDIIPRDTVDNINTFDIFVVHLNA